MGVRGWVDDQSSGFIKHEKMLMFGNQILGDSFCVSARDSRSGRERGGCNDNNVVVLYCFTRFCGTLAIE